MYYNASRTMIAASPQRIARDSRMAANRSLAGRMGRWFGKRSENCMRRCYAGRLFRATADCSLRILRPSMTGMTPSHCVHKSTNRLRPVDSYFITHTWSISAAQCGQRVRSAMTRRTVTICWVPDPVYNMFGSRARPNRRTAPSFAERRFVTGRPPSSDPADRSS